MFFGEIMVIAEVVFENSMPSLVSHKKEKYFFLKNHSEINDEQLLRENSNSLQGIYAKERSNFPYE